MAFKTRPEVKALSDGGTCFEVACEKSFLKVYVPSNDLNGQVNDYTFRAPLLLVLEEERMSMSDAISFAKETGLEKIAADFDASVVFVYPTAEGGWNNADESLYAEVISNVKMYPDYKDGIVEFHNFITQTFEGFFVRGAIFRADIYSYGASADYVATHLLKTIQGKYLWGPGEITPAMCSMERLSVLPVLERKDIPIVSVGNSLEINASLKASEWYLEKENAEYVKDYYDFVWRFKRWCGHIEEEPDFKAMGLCEDAGFTEVTTSSDNRFVKTPTHKIGYFAYHNKGIFKKGPVPLLIGFHGGGDSSFYFTYVAGWWQVCHDHDFLFVSIDNHLAVTATEVMDVLEDLKKKYPIDEHRIYAAGFSMGSGKTWDMFMEYPNTFAGLAPGSALFEMKNNEWGKSITDDINFDVPVPIFYSGGELSPLPELPSQMQKCIDRIEYLAGVNRLKCGRKIPENKAGWDDKFYGFKPDFVEVFHDDVRDANLTVRYYESEDGVVRTALASIDNQQHEYRHHTAETAWNFISKFTR